MEFSSLLYGIRQDFSATETGLFVKNSRDEPVSTIIFHMAARKPWFSFEVEDQILDADVLPTLRQSVVLHPRGAEMQILCAFSRGRGRTYRFEAAGIGLLESHSSMRLSVAPRFEYFLDGRKIGVAQHIGGAVNRGQLLILPDNIPLPIRMLVMAMQSQRY